MNVEPTKNGVFEMTEKAIQRILKAISDVREDLRDVRDSTVEQGERLSRVETKVDTISKRASEDREGTGDIESRVMTLEKDKAKVIGASAGVGGVLGWLMSQLDKITAFFGA